MDLRALVREARRLLDDEAPQPLWTDQELIESANEAVMEACIRARLLSDTRSPAICRVPVRADIRDYTLHPSIIVLKRAKLASQTHEIDLFTTDYLDNTGDWEARTGSSERAVLDRNTRTLTLEALPTESDVINLDVLRIPIESERMRNWQDCPVACVHEMHHRNLVHWMLYRAYDRKDSETFDPARSADQRDKFEVAFGPRPSAHAIELWRRERGRKTKAFWV